MLRAIHTKRLAASRARWLTCAAFLSVALAVADCGGTSSSPGVAHLSSAKSASRASPEGGGVSPENPAGLQQAMIAYAKCMRANGVPNFPDPNGSGGFQVHGGFDPGSPVIRTAQAKCRHLMPPGPGSGPPPSAQTLARFLKIARCMRQHGVPQFPDPQTSAPPGGPPAGIAELSDIEGVILLFPGTIDQQSPVFTRAAAACAFPLHNH